MRGFSPRQDMQIQVVPQLSVRHHRVPGMLLGQILKLLEQLVVDDGVIFQPPHFAFRRPHFDKSLAPFDHFKRLAVRHLSHAVRNCGDSIMQKNLAG